MNRPWFLYRRITLAFAGTTLLLSLFLTIPFGWIVGKTVDEEMDALVREELDETRAYFIDRTPDLVEFRALTEEMSEEHEGSPLAWRIQRAKSGEVWGEFGDTALLVHVPAQLPSSILDVGDATRVGKTPLDGGLVAIVVLRAEPQRARLVRFLWAVAGFILLATAAASLAGRRLALRVSRLLGEVAASAGAEGAVENWVPPSAPEEIRAVVHALQDTLRRIREEGENARLLISGLAHELRSPLQNLMGETQVALLRERDSVEYRQVLESQLEDLGELSRVVDNLVTLSSVDEALRRRTVEHFDLAEEARLRLSREGQLARRRGVTLEILADGPLPMDGDRESLLLALRNVVTNAIEWSPLKGTVSVRMGSKGEELEILVDDAGPGVPPELRENIFRPFHRGPAAQGRRVGFGLGMALTHSAVRAQGGTIEVGDSPLGGARFRIVLPRAGHA